MRFETWAERLQWLDDRVWGTPLLTLLLATGLLLTLRTGGAQLRYLGLGLKSMFQKGAGEGEVSSFGALCTALSATIGTGNIVGVATAVCTGGPGALFWMVAAAAFGMATKFTECMLAVKYRQLDADGHVLGGPFYYIEKGMGRRWKWLGMLFAAFGALAGLLGIGTITQINGITSAAQAVFAPEFDPADPTAGPCLFGRVYAWPAVLAGLAVTVLVWLVLVGGLRRISQVATVVVPFMAVTYVSFCLLVLICNLPRLPAAAADVFSAAFTPRAAAGGAAGSVFAAMQSGVARGVFSNEAGLGSAPIAAAAARTQEPVCQGAVSMLGTGIDTMLLCTMTGLAIVVTDAWQTGLEGVAVTTYAFQRGLPFSASFSAFVLMFCLALFAFTSILGWSYYAESCLAYLFKGRGKWVGAYRGLYVLAVFAGPYLTVSAVWTIADIFNGLMALPNLLALLALSGVAAREVRRYDQKRKAEKTKTKAPR